MAGILALIGGEEFAEGFEETHARLLSLVRFVRPGLQERKVKVAFLPTCAADDGAATIEYWCDLAREKLEPLGASVTPLRVVDQNSANDPDLAEQLLASDWIYLGGGYPHVAMRIFHQSVMLQAIYAAHQQGALICGASGGAMLMCARSWVFTPELGTTINKLLAQEVPVTDWDLPGPPTLNCLGFIPHAICWPHINRLVPPGWLKEGLLPPGYSLIGIDEQTAALSLVGDRWEVLGRGRVIIVDPQHNRQTYHPGDRIILPV